MEMSNWIGPIITNQRQGALEKKHINIKQLHQSVSQTYMEAFHACATYYFWHFCAQQLSAWADTAFISYY